MYRTNAFKTFALVVLAGLFTVSCAKNPQEQRVGPTTTPTMAVLK